MEQRHPIADQIDVFAASLKGSVVTPHHPTYEALRLGPVGGYEHHRPAALVRVANAADVAAAVNFARSTGLELAIRSGGHSTVGHSGCDGGLVIDLRGIDTLEIDPVARTAWAGAGLTAGDVTGAAERHGLIVGFGDTASVGIGGITLGGGVGYLTRKFGLTIDSLLAAEIVTAEGDILIADETSHPELFWALRGGGGNFGVVTRLKFRLHPLPAFTGGPLILPATPETIAGFAAASAAAPDELTTIGLVMGAPPLPFIPPALHGQLVLMGMMAYAGDVASAQPALAPFRALATPIADLVGPIPFAAIYTPEEPDMRPVVAIRSRLMDTLGLAEAKVMLAALEACDAPMKMGQIRVLGGAAARVPTEATAYAHRDAGFLVAVLALHGGGDAADGYERWAADALAALGGESQATYVNFLADEGGERLRAAYPHGTWERLRAVKRRYDPANLFRRNHNIPPA